MALLLEEIELESEIIFRLESKSSSVVLMFCHSETQFPNAWNPFPSPAAICLTSRALILIYLIKLQSECNRNSICRFADFIFIRKSTSDEGVLEKAFSNLETQTDFMINLALETSSSVTMDDSLVIRRLAISSSWQCGLTFLSVWTKVSH